MTAPRKRRTTRKSTRRRRPSTATTIGGVVGAAVAGLLAGLLDAMPWWLWVVLLAVGLGVGYLVHRRSAPAQ
ncbi:hypothetical protein [Actinokineospora sp.]|uniref:hypothetical protein n=1 Tax=Actinokineospora sp. TaxID=1872133 RepID=UPI004037AB09